MAHFLTCVGDVVLALGVDVVGAQIGIHVPPLGHVDTHAGAEAHLRQTVLADLVDDGATGVQAFLVLKDVGAAEVIADGGGGQVVAVIQLEIQTAGVQGPQVDHGGDGTADLALAVAGDVAGAPVVQLVIDDGLQGVQLDHVLDLDGVVVQGEVKVIQRAVGHPEVPGVRRLFLQLLVGGTGGVVLAVRAVRRRDAVGLAVDIVLGPVGRVGISRVEIAQAGGAERARPGGAQHQVVQRLVTQARLGGEGAAEVAVVIEAAGQVQLDLLGDGHQGLDVGGGNIAHPAGGVAGGADDVAGLGLGIVLVGIDPVVVLGPRVPADRPGRQLAHVPLYTGVPLVEVHGGAAAGVGGHGGCALGIELAPDELAVGDGLLGGGLQHVTGAVLLVVGLGVHVAGVPLHVTDAFCGDCALEAEVHAAGGVGDIVVTGTDVAEAVVGVGGLTQTLGGGGVQAVVGEELGVVRVGRIDGEGAGGGGEAAEALDPGADDLRHEVHIVVDVVATVHIEGVTAAGGGGGRDLAVVEVAAVLEADEGLLA